MDTVANWSGNVTMHPERYVQPHSLDELRQVVAGSEKVRAFGTGHAFNRIADTTGVLVGLGRLPADLEVDPVASTATVGAGWRYGELGPLLDAAGFALPNLGSLPHISIAGACATATHGSGVGNQVLASAVRAVDLVNNAGEVITVERGHPDFPGVAVSLGALGIMTRLTLDLQPSYRMSQRVYEGLEFAQVEGQLDAILASGYSVSVFTDFEPGPTSSVWVKRRAERADDPLGWSGGRRADGQRHPLSSQPAGTTTPQLGEPGPWYRRLPHFRLDFTPASGDELQSEYFLPRAAATDALTIVRAARDSLRGVLLISEIRAVAADEFWLSPSYRRDTLALHFTWVNDERAVAPVLRPLEAALAELGATPHWGKVFFTAPSRLRSHFARWDDFAELRARLDPTDKFSNDFIRSFFPSHPPIKSGA